MTTRQVLLIEFLEREPVAPRYSVTQPADGRKAQITKQRSHAAWLAMWADATNGERVELRQHV